MGPVHRLPRHHPLRRCWRKIRHACARGCLTVPHGPMCGGYVTIWVLALLRAIRYAFFSLFGADGWCSLRTPYPISSKVRVIFLLIHCFTKLAPLTNKCRPHPPFEQANFRCGYAIAAEASKLITKTKPLSCEDNLSVCKHLQAAERQRQLGPIVTQRAGGGSSGGRPSALHPIQQRLARLRDSFLRLQHSSTQELHAQGLKDVR